MASLRALILVSLLCNGCAFGYASSERAIGVAAANAWLSACEVVASESVDPNDGGAMAVPCPQVYGGQPVEATKEIISGMGQVVWGIAKFFIGFLI